MFTFPHFLPLVIANADGKTTELNVKHYITLH